jgi:hypothetical protein
VTATVCWIQHGGEINWARAIAGRLREHGIETRFVSFLREMADGYRQSGWPSDFICDIFKEPPLEPAELYRLEREYGPPSLRCIAASDVHLRQIFGDDEDRAMQIVARALAYWERYFKQTGVVAAIVRDQASFSTRSARQVAERLGTVRMLQIGTGPDDSRFTILDRDTSWCWSELGDELDRGTRIVPPERVRAVEEYIDGRVQPARKRPMSLNLYAVPLSRLPLEYLRSRRAERAIDADSDPMAIAVLRLNLEFQRKRSVWRGTRAFFRYDKPGTEPYVYLPFFHTEESGHLVNIRFWCRHIEGLVAQAAEALPLGHVLYVKEHPAILGDVPRAALRRMRRNPRVRILAPEEQSQSLTSGAAAVVALEGSVGWEAILLRRPVVVLSGTPFYARCPLAYWVGDVCALDVALAKAIVAGPGIYEERRDEWIWFIDCVLRTAPPGVIETYEFPHVTPQQEENIRRISDALVHKIAQLVPQAAVGAGAGGAA